ncbi:MAG TPA: dienelactone hydrolase family protein [Longimicrobiales bacterium]|nr:dienelactone hydrolase family protein [Longimicrobiales bacterium]
MKIPPRPIPALRLVAAGTLILGAVAGCAPAGDDTPASGDAPTSDSEAVVAAAGEAHVPVAPTADDELPSAIIGEGGELQGQDLQYLEGDDATTGYLAVPEGEGPFPSLVIIHEWNGLTDRVRQVADDFAAEGYVTLAADLFRGQVGENPEENMALMAEAEGDVVPNLNAAVRYLKGRDDVTGRVGAMGWCYGGGVALSFGLDGENHDATAIFYGRLVEDPEVLSGMDHEVYGTFARLDNGPAPESVERFEAALEAAGIENDLHIYDDVDHGFWLRVDGAPDVRTEPALDAWQRLKAYLARTLGD